MMMIMIKVEDGRDGGNPEFDGDVQDQYQDEVDVFTKYISPYMITFHLKDQNQ